MWKNLVGLELFVVMIVIKTKRLAHQIVKRSPVFLSARQSNPTANSGIFRPFVILIQLPIAIEFHPHRIDKCESG